MRSRLVGFITFTRRLLDGRRLDELEARKETAPLGNVKKIAGASPQTTARPDNRRKP